jgi:hypothetical protein
VISAVTQAEILSATGWLTLECRIKPTWSTAAEKLELDAYDEKVGGFCENHTA